MLSHGNLAAMTHGYFCDVDEVAADGRLLHAAPMSHGSGLYTFTHLAPGAAQVVPESRRLRRRRRCFALLEAHAKVSMFAAPTMVKRLAEAAAAAGARARGLQTLVYGGGPMYLADLRAAMQALGTAPRADLRPGREPDDDHGAVDKRRHARARASALRSSGSPPWACRRPWSRSTVRDAGRAASCPRARSGEVCVRGDAVMAGYWTDPEATAQRAARRLAVDGRSRQPSTTTASSRSRTAARTSSSAAARTSIRARSRRCCSRTRASPRRASWGARIREWGEAVVAFVVRARRRRPPQAELDALCLAHIARFKRPKEYRFVDAPAEEPLRQGGEDGAARGARRRRPGRAGIALMLFPGFRRELVRTSGVDIARRGRAAPRRARAAAAARLPADARDLAQVAPRLARALQRGGRRTCAATGIRASPRARPTHAAYSKRAMARGPGRAHAAARPRALLPRGPRPRRARRASPARSTTRRASSRLAVLDIAPTLAMYEQTDRGVRARLLALVLPDPAGAGARDA